MSDPRQDDVRPPPRQGAFLPFLLAGAVAAAANIGARALFSLALPFELAVLLAFLVGMAVAFVINRTFVFAPSGRDWRSEALRFVLVNLVGLAQVWLVSVGLAGWLFPSFGFVGERAELVAHAIGVASPIVTSYYGHKLFSFGRR